MLRVKRNARSPHTSGRREELNIDRGNRPTIRVSSDYRAGYGKACLADREAADNYIAHTHVGDRVVYAIVEELASLPQGQVVGLLRAGMDED